MLRGRFLSYCDSFKGRLRSWVSDRSPPCVCGRDVIEVTDGPQPPPTEVGLVFESGASSRVAQLEAEIAQLKDALARRQQIGVATGLLDQRFAHHPKRAWSLLVRVSQNGHVKVRDIAQAIINAHSVDSAQQRSKYSA